MGPSFSNYLQLFNSNGWLETDRPDLADGPDAVGPYQCWWCWWGERGREHRLPVVHAVQLPGRGAATPSFKPLPPSGNSFFQSPPKFDVLTNEKSSRLLNTPKFDVLTNEKSSRDVNSRVSNLFNRMTTSDGNSIPLTFSLSPIVFNNKGNPIGESDHSFRRILLSVFLSLLIQNPGTVLFSTSPVFRSCLRAPLLRICAPSLESNYGFPVGSELHSVTSSSPVLPRTLQSSLYKIR